MNIEVIVYEQRPKSDHYSSSQTINHSELTLSICLHEQKAVSVIFDIQEQFRQAQLSEPTHLNSQWVIEISLSEFSSDIQSTIFI